MNEGHRGTTLAAPPGLKREIRWGGVRQKRDGQRETPRPLHAHFWGVFKK